MLVFGPYRAIPPYEDFIIFNLSSLTESIPRLPGLFMIPNIPNSNIIEDREKIEKDFDLWYYNYIINDIAACSSLMSILSALYDGKKVFICIADYDIDSVQTLNESFMKFLQSRYDIVYSIINNQEDYLYIPKDGCDFQSVAGIMNFDQDRKTFMQLMEEQRLMNGGSINCEI